MRNVVEKAGFKVMTVLFAVCILLTAVFAAEMSVTGVQVHAEEAGHLKADNLPQNTDYILVIDDSGSMWYDSANNMQFIRNAATQTFLRISKGSNNRIAVVYFSMLADYENNGCGLTSTNTDKGYAKIMECLQHSVDKKTKRTTDNASTNIPAGLNQACDILDNQKNENKPVIILFTDGYNMIFDLENVNNDRETKLANINAYTLGGIETDLKTGEKKKVDGVNTRIKNSAYELYTVYLEDQDPKNVSEQGKENRRFLNELTETSNENANDVTHFYKVNQYECSENCYELADEFANVFYASQINSKHKDIQLDKDGDASIYIPPAAVDHLNIYLTNVPEGSTPVLSHSGSNEPLEYETDPNNRALVYFNITNPEPGDYTLHVPDAGISDEKRVKGGYVYYTDLQSDIDLVKKNMKGRGDVGVKSEVGIRCSFYDADGNPYVIKDGNYFDLMAGVSRVTDNGQKKIQKKICDLPMQRVGDYWESTEDFAIEEAGEYCFTATAKLDPEENNLVYSKKMRIMDTDYMYYAIWAIKILIVLIVLALIRCFYKLWKKHEIKRIREKVAEEVMKINEVDQLMAEQGEKAVSYVGACEKASGDCNDAEESLDEVITKKHLSELQEKELLIDKFKRVKNQLEAEYLEHKKAYTDSSDKFLNYISEFRKSGSNGVPENASMKEARKTLKHVIDARKEAQILYDKSKEHFGKFSDYDDRYKKCLDLAEEAYNRTDKMLKLRARNGLKVRWSGYTGFRTPKGTDDGFFKLGDINVFDSNRRINTLGSVLKDIADAELKIDVYGKEGDVWVHGFELHSQEEFIISSPSTNGTLVKKKTVNGDEDVVYYAADLVEGEKYSLSIGVPGIGSIEIEPTR